MVSTRLKTRSGAAQPAQQPPLSASASPAPNDGRPTAQTPRVATSVQPQPALATVEEVPLKVEEEGDVKPVIKREVKEEEEEEEGWTPFASRKRRRRSEAPEVEDKLQEDNAVTKKVEKPAEGTAKLEAPSFLPPRQSRTADSQLPFPTSVMKRVIAQPSLEQGDHLRLCLVCHAWLPIARAALYRSLGVTIEEYWYSHLIFSPTVDVRLHPYREHPHLARLARSLTITRATGEPDVNNWFVSSRWLDRQQESSRSQSDTSDGESDYENDYDAELGVVESMKYDSTSLRDVLEYRTAAVQAYIKTIKIPDSFSYFDHLSSDAAPDATSFRHFSALTTLDIPIFLPFTTAQVPNLRSYTFGFNANDELVEVPEVDDPPPAFATLRITDSYWHDEEGVEKVFTWLTSASLNSLTHLQLPFYSSCLSSLPSFTALKGVHIGSHEPCKQSERLAGGLGCPPWIAALPSTVVSLTLQIPDDDQTVLDALLSVIPSSLLRFTLLRTYPDTLRFRLTNRTWLPSLRLIRVERDNHVEGWADKVEKACEKRGVGFERVVEVPEAEWSDREDEEEEAEEGDEMAELHGEEA